MATLSREYRRELERVIIEARRVGENGAAKALKALAVDHHEPLGGSTKEQRDLRNRLRAHGRQVGDKLDPKRGTQTTTHLASEVAYEHWHRMLFARLLAENNVLIESESGVALSLEECREYAREKHVDWVELASSFAVKMLPQIFRPDDPVLEVSLPPEIRKKLEELLESLPAEVFAADDSLGWVYQFWQSELKDQVNASGEKIGADELPAVTQLFTEDYMVLFLLHNTLGAWWTAKRKAEGKDPNLPGYEWTYLRLNEDGTPAAGAFEGWPKLARDITLLDPSMGSGHFLTFALPILVGFRMEEEGLSREEAVIAVLRDNLFGLEIDNRCTQIAAFNLALIAWRMVGFRTLPPLNLACSGIAINAERRAWVRLAGQDPQLQQSMEQLYGMFSKALLLGSLIDPRRAGATLFSARFEEARETLEGALARESGDEEKELAVAAKGIMASARLLAHEFTLIATNVPYLGRGRQHPALREYCDVFHPTAKGDLATCFVERCMSFLANGGTSALVTPQNWLFQDVYTPFRKHWLGNCTWNLIARLGEHGFESQQAAGAFTALVLLTKRRPEVSGTFAGLDLTSIASPIKKAAALVSDDITFVNQLNQVNNPDARVSFSAKHNLQLLSAYASYHNGIQTGDYQRFGRCFWEFQQICNGWVPQQSTVLETRLYGGLEHVLRWEDGTGELYEFVVEKLGKQQVRSWLRGSEAWGKRGIAVSAMRELNVSLYQGTLFDDNTVVLIPRDEKAIPAIWAFCSSPSFHVEVRKLVQNLKVRGPLVEVPFDIEDWRRVAETTYGPRLPKPSSLDATQWIFSGTPRSEQPLQVSVGRLIGYGWPRQTGSDFMDCPSLSPDGLEKHADDDGIVPLGAIKGEGAAGDRLRALFADAFGKEWSGAKLAEMLGQVGYTGKSLDDWLRDGFFEQHCDLFHQRPFIWHISDGVRGGFAALVNYHKLCEGAGAGRRLLEKLTYGYLGDWIERQRADQKQGVEGSDIKLAAAEHLQKELININKGEPPYDIFVRWKPLHEQPLGWEPDINDGVRVNIRPFMMAKVLNGRGKNACILRSTPKIKWDKDRGKDPHRSKDEFPWFWSWDEQTPDFLGGREFDGNRWNDLHYSIKTKKEARDRYKEKQGRKGAAK